MSVVEKDDELELLDANQVAALFHVPVSWVRGAVRGRSKTPIPHIKLGKYVRFQEHAVRDWIDQQKKGYPRKRH